LTTNFIAARPEGPEKSATHPQRTGRHALWQVRLPRAYSSGRRLHRKPGNSRRLTRNRCWPALPRIHRSARDHPPSGGEGRRRARRIIRRQGDGWRGHRRADQHPQPGGHRPRGPDQDGRRYLEPMRESAAVNAFEQLWERQDRRGAVPDEAPVSARPSSPPKPPAAKTGDTPPASSFPTSSPPP
jgi:hypothetical protein